MKYCQLHPYLSTYPPICLSGDTARKKEQTQTQLLHHLPFPKLWAGAVSRYRERLLLRKLRTQQGAPVPGRQQLCRGPGQRPAPPAEPPPRAALTCSRQLFILYGTMRRPRGREGLDPLVPSRAGWNAASGQHRPGLTAKVPLNPPSHRRAMCGFAATRLLPDHQPAAGNTLYSCAGEE